MEIKEREKNQKGITMHDEKNVLESAIGKFSGPEPLKVICTFNRLSFSKLFSITKR
jgi:hypothetical protein